MILVIAILSASHARQKLPFERIWIDKEKKKAKYIGYVEREKRHYSVVQVCDENSRDSTCYVTRNAYPVYVTADLASTIFFFF